ncbi:MAG: protein-disulfide reductase DsbD family protein [Myxococcota bacterium]
MTRSGRWCSFGLVLLLALAGAPGAQARLDVPEGALHRGIVLRDEAQVEARLLVDAVALRPGDDFSVGVLFDLEPGWHIYWRHPGKVGLPTVIRWTLSHATPGELEWPAPEVFVEGDGSLTSYGYTDQVLLFAPARLARTARGEIEIRAEVEYLACDHECIPGEARLSRRLPVAAKTKPAPDRVLELFQRYGERLPAPPEALDLSVEVLYSQSAIRPGDAFRTALALVACQGHTDLPHECPIVRPAPPSIRQVFAQDRIPEIELTVTDSRRHPRVPSGWLVTLAGLAGPEDPGEDQHLRGVVALERGDDTPIWVEVDLPLPRARPGSEVAVFDHPWLEPRAYLAGGAPASLPLWQAVLLGLLGGLILNLMPCVLPVLAIKVLGVAELAHEGRRQVLRHGAAYAAGVILTMLLLASVISTLRGVGSAVGWGFQFQEPLFLATLSVVLFVFALNLFGVFQIYSQGGRLARAGLRAAGVRRSFFEGLLAVVVATPCSAPFLGTAVGFALASPTPVIFAVFAAIGLGLAAPYALITLVPGWARVIPRPGPWMERVRALLGFGLLGTVIWLARVMGTTTGAAGMTALLVLLLAVAAACWLYGITQGSGRLPRLGGVTLAAALVVTTGFLTLRFPESASEPASSGEGAIAWEPFNPERIRAAVADGRTAFVDFTADWCITCGVNERLVLQSPVVVHELERLDVATFKADWTRRNETIRRELARHGRAGVPMYLIYRPNAPDDPILLPELLTIDGVVEALRAAAGAGDVRVSAKAGGSG